MDAALVLLIIAGIVAVLAAVRPQVASVRIGWLSIALIAFSLALTT